MSGLTVAVIHITKTITIDQRAKNPIERIARVMASTNSRAGRGHTGGTLLCKSRASSYSISYMETGARARRVRQLQLANEMIANRIVNKSIVRDKHD